MDYYIADNGQQRGPFSPEQLQSQGLRGDTLVWAEGMGQWERADRVPALQAVLAPAAAPAATPMPYAAAPGPMPGAMPGGMAGPAPGGYYAPPAGPGPAGYGPPAYGPAGYGPTVGYGGYQAGGYVAPYNQADAANKKLAAGLCGILLGGFGIHKFILGYTSAGVTYLLISLVGGMVTCGATTAVMGIIGLVEGIIYLTKSDQDFYNQYIAQQKQWF